MPCIIYFRFVFIGGWIYKSQRRDDDQIWQMQPRATCLFMPLALLIGPNDGPFPEMKSIFIFPAMGGTGSQNAEQRKRDQEKKKYHCSITSGNSWAT